MNRDIDLYELAACVDTLQIIDKVEGSTYLYAFEQTDILQHVDALENPKFTLINDADGVRLVNTHTGHEDFIASGKFPLPKFNFSDAQYFCDDDVAFVATFCRMFASREISDVFAYLLASFTCFYIPIEATDMGKFPVAKGGLFLTFDLCDGGFCGENFICQYNGGDDVKVIARLTDDNIENYRNLPQFLHGAYNGEIMQLDRRYASYELLTSDLTNCFCVPSWLVTNSETYFDFGGLWSDNDYEDFE